MTTKYYLDKAGLEELVNNINTQIENFKVAVATAEEAGIIKPGLGLVVENDGTLSISEAYTDQILAQANSAADRASASATVAGNYAAEAIQAEQVVVNKFWYGTMEEYNNLESISHSTIYIILHE